MSDWDESDSEDKKPKPVVQCGRGRGLVPFTNNSIGNDNSTSSFDWKPDPPSSNNYDWNNDFNDRGRGRDNRPSRGRGRGGFRNFNDGDNDFGGSDSFQGRRGRGGSDQRGRGCFKCKEIGHMSRDCPNEDQSHSFDSSQRKKGCFKCGEEGHMAKDCTNPPSQEGDKENIGPDGKPRPPLYIPKEIEDDALFGQGVNIGINFDAFDNIPVRITGDDPIAQPISNFSQSGLRSVLLENVKKASYTKPTPIQKYSIPVIMSGRDLMGCAQTGSGKTAAFLLPILHYILENDCSSHAYEDSGKPTAVIIAPTRELAIQINQECRKFSIGSVVRNVLAYGGASTGYQLRQISTGCHILVATPGRLKDFVSRGKVTFGDIKFLVLDEADRMLDMGFKDDIAEILRHPTMPSKENRVTLMFSATFPTEIQHLAARHLNQYVFLVIGVLGAASGDVNQTIQKVTKHEKRETLVSLLKEIFAANSDEKVLVFVETKRTADFIAVFLSSQEMSATSIHGDRFQSQREEALAQFKSGIRNTLVATAVAARGLDIKGVGYVINYDLPKEIDEYVHRIGRTGRVGNRGQAISFYDESQDASLCKDLEKILSDANQVVPDWLKHEASVSMHSGTLMDGTSAFTSSDIRAPKSNYPMETFGGPLPAASNEEESWSDG